jgi:hypothetical protein
MSEDAVMTRLPSALFTTSVYPFEWSPGPGKRSVKHVLSACEPKVAFRETKMKKLSLLGIVIGATLLTAAPISIQPSPKSGAAISK